MGPQNIHPHPPPHKNALWPEMEGGGGGGAFFFISPRIKARRPRDVNNLQPQFQTIILCSAVVPKNFLFASFLLGIEGWS